MIMHASVGSGTMFDQLDQLALLVPGQITHLRTVATLAQLVAVEIRACPQLKTAGSIVA